MQQDLCTIPIADVFAPKDGCPICSLYTMLEERALDFVMGAAMMEPEIRLLTNAQGFCTTHYQKMLSMNNRLSLALMLESHLDTVQQAVQVKKGQADACAQLVSGCYVCNVIRSNLSRMILNVYKTFTRDLDFRRLVAEQPYYCLPHYTMLQSGIKGHLSKKDAEAFSDAITEVENRALTQLRADVHSFCGLYDYRAQKEEATPQIKQAIERTIAYLTAKPMPGDVKL
jgi:hypothetical protein